jgi:hypothetical protein
MAAIISGDPESGGGARVKNDRKSEETALADRIVNYSDALVAVAFLGVSGLGVAVADPDIRCSVATAIPQIMGSNLINAIVLSGLVLWLRKWEIDLRVESPHRGKVAKYVRWLHVARLVIIWTSFLMSIALVLASAGAECV